MTNSTDATLYEVSEGVATITLNRPDNKNALSVEMVNSIGDHLAEAQLDPGVRAILFTNSGNTFCAGADLKASQPGVTQPEARHSFVQILDDIIESPPYGQIVALHRRWGRSCRSVRHLYRRGRHHCWFHRSSDRCCPSSNFRNLPA